MAMDMKKIPAKRERGRRVFGVGSAALMNSISAGLVVGWLFRDRNVMGMALAKSGHRDLDKATILDQLRESCHARVSHAGAETAHELEHEMGQRPFVRDTSLDPFGYELPLV